MRGNRCLGALGNILSRRAEWRRLGKGERLSGVVEDARVEPGFPVAAPEDDLARDALVRRARVDWSRPALGLGSRLRPRSHQEGIALRDISHCLEGVWLSRSYAPGRASVSPRARSCRASTITLSELRLGKSLGRLTDDRQALELEPVTCTESLVAAKREVVERTKGRHNGRLILARRFQNVLNSGRQRAFPLSDGQVPRRICIGRPRAN